MSLRIRLVLSLVVMMAIGLAVYGVATYRGFANAELSRLDDDLRASVGLVAQELASPPGFGPIQQGQDGTAPPIVVAPGTYAELRAPDGTVVATLQVARSDARPDLSAVEPGRIVTVGSREGDGRWRALAHPTDRGGSLVVAAPTTAVERSLDRLLAIEVAAGAALLALLAAGAWALLRRELRPLERIAETAGTITAGALDRRVPNEAPDTEVGRVATALNEMLDELETAFSEREASEARLRRFLADASHELRTPLTSIQGFAELFRLDSERRHAELPVILRRIEEESGRMRALVEDLLLLARLDEPAHPEEDEVDLAVLAADACTDAVAAEPQRPVRLEAPAPLPVRAHEAHLRQALANLVTNALRHTPPEAPVEVTASLDEDGRPTLTVRDHGPGLDEEALAHAFDRFWQADPARVGTGAGLGLSIVSAVAEEHDAEVAAVNAHDGGAVFSLRLPADRLVGRDEPPDVVTDEQAADTDGRDVAVDDGPPPPPALRDRSRR